MIDYKIIRSGRRTLAIEITRDAEVIVRAPMKKPQKDIEKFVSSHEGWIEKHLEKMKKKSDARKELSAEDIEDLRKKAKEILPKKVEHYSNLMGLYPTGIKITSAKICKGYLFCQILTFYFYYTLYHDRA